MPSSPRRTRSHSVDHDEEGRTDVFYSFKIRPFVCSLSNTICRIVSNYHKTNIEFDAAQVVVLVDVDTKTESDKTEVNSFVFVVFVVVVASR